MRTLVFWGLYWGPPILRNYLIIIISIFIILTITAIVIMITIITIITVIIITAIITISPVKPMDPCAYVAGHQAAKITAASFPDAVPEHEARRSLLLQTP